MRKELGGIKHQTQMSEVFETREVVSVSAQLSCEETEEERPTGAVSACLRIRDGGPDVVGADCMSSAETTLT